MELGSALRGLARLAVGLTLLCFASGRSWAEEPYERFLQKLRDEQLFDLALVYLDDLQGQAGVSASFKADVQLERGLLLYQAAATLSATNAERPRKLDDAEATLQNFLDSQKQHPRRGEARMKLGELLLTRAEEAKLRAAPDAQSDIVDAIKFYDQAHQLFESTIEELGGVLESMKGARTDASDAAAVAYRQKVQQDLRQSQLLSAKAVEDRGRSRGETSPQRVADLQTALKMFSELYNKEQRMIGIRNYSLFYRSGIQATLGQTDDAIDGYQRIADLEGVDILRPLQTNAITELIKSLGLQKKYPLAVDRADKWLADLRPDERTMTETLALKLELSKLKIAWADDLKDKDPSDRVASRLIRDSRNELRGMLRVPGAHLEKTRELLALLGIEGTESPAGELPKVASFSEALSAAQERIDRSETDSIGLEALKLELASPTLAAERKQELEEQLRSAQQAIDLDQQQALELLRSALQLYRSSDQRELLFDARFRLAFLLLKQQQPWDAMAVAEYLSRSAPGTEKGLRAAAITLGSFSDLLRMAAQDAKSQLTDQLQPFAEYLVATWPQSSEAAAAASALVQLALINQDFAKAEQFLSLVPSEGEAAAKLRRDAGISFYAKYLEEKNVDGHQGENASRLRKQAISLLQSGVAGLSEATLDTTAIDAVNILARLLLADEQLDAAAKLLFDSDASPLKALEKNTAGVPVRVIMETFRTAIQLEIALLAEDQLPADQAVTRIHENIARLQAAATDAESTQTLAGIFVGLARDLKEQLAATEEESKRIKMSETLLIVAVEAAKAESFNSEYWAADTILSIAQELETTPAGKAPATYAYGEASKILDAILAKEQTQPGWIQPPEIITQIRLRLAQTARGLGDYKRSIEQLATILEKSSGLLDVQMEAARTYQAWGTAVNSGFHKVAIEGGRPDPKTRQKLIWGWGKIQQMTANQPKYAEQFFEARYQLAASRMLYAQGLSDPEQRTAEIHRAQHDIESTAKLFPTLGGPAMKRRFETLLKTIQQAKVP